MHLGFFKLPQVNFQNLSFLAHCTSSSIQNKCHIFSKLQEHFLEGDIKIWKYVSRFKICSFLEIERSNPVCWGKCPDYGIFSHEAFFLFVCCSRNVFRSGLISRNLLCLETLLVACLIDHHGLLSEETFEFWTSLNIHSFNDFILSNISILKLVFHSHDA